MWRSAYKGGMTRDELIEELQQCPYDTEVEIRVHHSNGIAVLAEDYCIHKVAALAKIIIHAD